jgi:hypothetical protein
VSAKTVPNPPSSSSDVPPPRPRDNSSDQQQRHGASAYIDQSEYDTYKQSTVNSASHTTKQDGANRGAYSNYTTDNNKNRYVQDTPDDDYPTPLTNEYSTGQHYPKNSSTTSYTGLNKIHLFIVFENECF